MLELPQYRWPTVRSLSLRLYDRSALFLKKAGTVILGGQLRGLGPQHFAVHFAQDGQFSDLATASSANWAISSSQYSARSASTGRSASAC